MGLQNLYREIRETVNQLADAPIEWSRVDATQTKATEELRTAIAEYGGCTSVQADEICESLDWLAEFWVQSAVSQDAVGDDNMFVRVRNIYANLAKSVLLGVLVAFSKFSKLHNFTFTIDPTMQISGGRVSIRVADHLVVIYVQQLLTELDPRIIQEYPRVGSASLSQILNAKFVGDSATVVDHGSHYHTTNSKDTLESDLTFCVRSFKELYQELSIYC